MTLPDYTGRTFFSAAVQNEWSRTLLQYFARAAAPAVLPIKVNSNTIDLTSSFVAYWSGFILYTGDTDTFRYEYVHVGGGHTAIYINNVLVQEATGTGVKSGTVDLSTVVGLSLVAGTVYSVRLDSKLDTGTPTLDIHWLGLDHNPTYTTPPTLSNGGTYTAANAAAILAAINEIGENIAMPIASFPYLETSADHDDDNEYVRWRGYLFHAHNTLRYRLTIDFSIAGKGRWNIYVNGTNVASAQTEGVIEATADLTALGLTRGNLYEIKVTVERTGTASTVNIDCTTWLLAEESGNAPATVNIWSHGDTDISAGNLNWYRDTINKIHPGATSPDTPIYWRQPAINTHSQNRYYIRHVRRYLRYRYDGAGTPDLEFGSTSVALSATAGNQSYDLLQISTLTLGQYYLVDDVEYAQEYDTEGP